ncbi:hypothetical protein R9X50_00639300 [Acrodontium crateriforme]|uniref:Small ribosomal subunit protein uS9m n=1 Tax=Acrodontium crateriforme TaxID=150365 RepID=A0AAQ3MA01_9PEZI|nr:hypothetical protein R9X50_00639300 [Acrodontium crateriforme]
MESTALRVGAVKRAVTCYHRPVVRQAGHFMQRRAFASSTTTEDSFDAAEPIHFSSDRNQFSKRSTSVEAPQHRGRIDLARLRVVPHSPSYFTSAPQYTDDLLHLSALLRRHHLLPVLPPGQAPRVAWKTIDQYKTETAEPVRVKEYSAILTLLKRLNYIHPSLLPAEVLETLQKYKRDVQPHLNQAKPILVDEYGCARAVGRRKSSNVRVTVVEGDGQCMINGRSLTNYFGRLHDRESALWALKSTERLDKYNVWAVASGGGTTGQAEAMTLGVAKALMAHEPALKPALRRAGCVARDPRRVERKKPGKLKARKMPAWVKR